MQLYAFDQKRQVIFARDALRQMDYLCPECSGVVRLRGGIHRQNHFYHLETVRACRQSGKSMEHLNVQLFLLDALPAGECALELRFPEIKRIADSVWMNQKIVFEIQCSPISRQEVEARSQDYQSLGFEVVWILHDKRYNQKRITAAEDFLHDRPHYFTNIDADGIGEIYDQFSQLDGGRRVNKLSPLGVDLTQPKSLEGTGKEGHFPGKMLHSIKQRLAHRSAYFEGDLVDQFFRLHASSGNLDDFLNAYFKAALKAEMAAGFSALSEPSNTLFEQLKAAFCRYVLRPYRLLFQLLLERACK